MDLPTTEIIEPKKVISSDLTPYASSILLDAEYGVPASKLRAASCGLIAGYEKTGYDASTPGRLPDLLDNWSVKRLKDLGADAVKFCSIMMWMTRLKSTTSSMPGLSGLAVNVRPKIFLILLKS